MSDELLHYNHNHDPKTGQFASSTVFVSGSSKTQSKDSPYYQKKLARSLRKELKGEMKSGNKIIVGDAPGIDRQVQDYLKKKKYKNVEVYSPGKESRYLADKSWKNNLIDDPDHEPGSKEWLAKKDKIMSKVADRGIAVILDEGSNATKNNIRRLQAKNKDVSIYYIEPGDKMAKMDLNKRTKLNAKRNKQYEDIFEDSIYYSKDINKLRDAMTAAKKTENDLFARYKKNVNEFARSQMLGAKANELTDKAMSGKLTEKDIRESMDYINKTKKKGGNRK